MFRWVHSQRATALARFRRMSRGLGGGGGLIKGRGGRGGCVLWVGELVSIGTQEKGHRGRVEREERKEPIEGKEIDIAVEKAIQSKGIVGAFP